jgi:Cobalamin biosynthesis protein CobN and related Mg-chelatases
MQSCPERAEALAAKTVQLIRLRKAERSARKLAIVVFNFPPNSGATATAAFMAVHESLYATLQRLAAEGYDVEVPESLDAMRDILLKGNAERYGTDANVAHRIPATSMCGARNTPPKSRPHGAPPRASSWPMAGTS